MLAPEGLQTPRPRPPAQMRRSTSKGNALNEGAPPPPYALEFPSLYEGADCDTSDPVVATAMMMGIQLDEDIQLSPTTVAEVSQKSREELANLFLQAEKIIRARETELSLAANLGKTLLEKNEALKLRHDALLSRLPVMQSQASTFAPPSRSAPKSKPSTTDPWTTDDDVPTTSLHSRSSSIPGSACGSPTHSRTSSVANSLAHRSHARRISASPSALLALSETNAELIAELTLLRASTDSEQIEGARRLRKLEREIGGLKVELDASQRTNAELEERVKEQLDEDRKREREERLRRLRVVEDSQNQVSDQETRDFAPQGQGVDTWDSIATPRLSRKAPPPIDTGVTDSEPGGPHSAYDGSISSVASLRSVSQYSTISPGEYAVVAQLYRKVEELQEANAELGARNRIVHQRLQRAERDALEIKRVYDEIGEELGADADVEQSDGDEGWNSTVRRKASPTRSLRSPRSPRSVTPRASSWVFRSQNTYGLAAPFSDETPTNKGKTSTRALGNKHMYKGTPVLKRRKPLTDTLFASPSTHDDTAGATPSIVFVPSRSPRLRTKGRDREGARALSFRSRSPLDSLAGRRKYSSSSHSTVRSASASSFLTTSSYASLARYVRQRGGRRSLGSELGDEFGADWGTGPELVRQSTLFDDESLRAESFTYRSEDEDEEHEDPALAALRHALSPPYAGRLLDEDEHILPVGALRSSPGEAFQVVSRAVVVRPNRWLECDDRRIRGPGPCGMLMDSAFFTQYSAEAEDPWETTRYPDIEPGGDDRASVCMRTCRRELALDRMATTRRASLSDDTIQPSSSLSHLQMAEVPLHDSHNVVERIKRTSADALIELWIFLQFVVVMCTFLYTMARRGPREVLGAPARRN